MPNSKGNRHQFLFLKSARNQRGQVAIFVALIFQLLFLFFAMVVNVGLLVHHKINLQNSVDLAAYYGASKQAEMLNAMAHVNYQIRQSWKLLAWRYRVIGSGGDRISTPGAAGNPFFFNGANPSSSQLQTSWVNVNADEENPNTSGGIPRSSYYRFPSFCVNYNPFEPANTQEENTCKKISENRFDITQIQVPNLNVGQAYAAAVKANVTAAKAAQQMSCAGSGTVNFATLMAMTVGFDFDQYARRLLIAQMSKALSLKETAFYDINGDNARDGILKTLQNNLTIANRESLTSFDIYNSLGASECAGPNAAKESAAWLKDIQIFPFLLYNDNKPNSAGNECDFGYKIFFNSGTGNIGMPKNYPAGGSVQGFTDYISQFQSFAGKPPPEFRYTLGYEKNPWCMAYVGVKAKTQPRIPFAPAIVELSAKSFAKPFGGRFGPWYYNSWSRGSDQSEGGVENRTDRLAPPRLTTDFDATALQTLVDQVRTSVSAPNPDYVSANYSRFPGDRLGLMSMRVLGEYTRAVHAVASNPPENNLHIANWLHISDPPLSTDHADMLYWNNNSTVSPKLRDIEAAAIAPDLFDVTYYSIDPNFYENYYLKLKPSSTNRLLSSIDYTPVLRGDLGSRLTAGSKDREGNDLVKFSVRDQIKIFRNMGSGTPRTNEFALNGQEILLQTLKNPFQTLTGWTAKNLLSYGALDSENKEYFGKCVMATDDEDNNSTKGRGGSIKSIAPDRYTNGPGDCVVGGRTGYSVKMISEQYLNSTMEIGGVGTPASNIKNPPPTGW